MAKEKKVAVKTAPKWEIKDRLYELKGKKTPIVFILKSKGIELRSKVKEKLSKNDWFASLDMEKQKLLTRYIQSRMCQKYALNNLEQIHQKNINLVSTIKQDHSNLGN